jgi:glutamate synthase (NADPH) small chain
MGKPTGFKEYARFDHGNAQVDERIHHYREFAVPLPQEELSRQGARCMDCGIPFCHQGCPVDNIIPDFNDLVYHDQWREALQVLHSTNNFPEFTGRVCPAPCEAACTLNLTDEPVTIKTIECAIIDRGWSEGWIHPRIPAHRSGKRVAVIGSGPAGLACAQQLARAGHAVVVYEKDARIGGLLRYGIPDFKLDKRLIDRRMAQMQAEGVEFRPNSHIGVDIPAKRLRAAYDAVVLAGGAGEPRDLPVPGRELKGIHFAMDFLVQQNKRVAGEPIAEDMAITAEGKDVMVIGGGDTGSDCIGTSVRQGALSVTQIEILPKPPRRVNKETTWPYWPSKLYTSSSHEEGCQRMWSIATQSFGGNDRHVDVVHAARVEWKDEDGAWAMHPIAGGETDIKADLVLLAMGFVHPVHKGALAEMELRLDERGNVKAETPTYQTSVEKVFATGDMRIGQSLVVNAIREGRHCAYAVDLFLNGESHLPR